LPVNRAEIFSLPEKIAQAEKAIAVMCRLIPPFADARFMFNGCRIR